MTDKSKRKHIRTRLRAEVKLTHPEVGDLKLHTDNISDGGAYILSEENQLPTIGELVAVQVQGMGGEDAPTLNMRIVRVDKGGIGLVFVNDDIEPESD